MLRSGFCAGRSPVGASAAFLHQSGDGLNVIWQALPLPHDGQCKLVIRAYDPDKEKAGPEKSDQQPMKKA
jgi:hypothetical protein